MSTQDGALLFMYTVATLILADMIRDLIHFTAPRWYRWRADRRYYANIWEDIVDEQEHKTSDRVIEIALGAVLLLCAICVIIIWIEG